VTSSKDMWEVGLVGSGGISGRSCTSRGPIDCCFGAEVSRHTKCFQEIPPKPLWIWIIPAEDTMLSAAGHIHNSPTTNQSQTTHPSSPLGNLQIRSLSGCRRMNLHNPGHHAACASAAMMFLLRLLVGSCSINA